MAFSVSRASMRRSSPVTRSRTRAPHTRPLASFKNATSSVWVRTKAPAFGGIEGVRGAETRGVDPPFVEGEGALDALSERPGSSRRAWARPDSLV